MSTQLKPLENILTTYKNYQNQGAGFQGYWNRFFSGNAYHGNADKKKYKNFIKLVDRLALIDSSGQWIGSLIDLYNKMINEALAHDNDVYFSMYFYHTFIDRFYHIFEDWQKLYFLNRQEENARFQSELIKAYIPEEYQQCEEHKQWFYHYFDKIVYGKKNIFFIPDQILDNLCSPKFHLGKLEYDLKQIRDHIQEQDESFETQAKAFKKAVHHVAENYDLPSKVKKRSATIDEPSIYYVDFNAKFTDVPQEKIEKRKTQIFSEKLATFKAVTSSIGEGGVTAVGFLGLFSFFPVVAVLGLIGFAGWYINRLLFQNDSEDVLNAFFIKKEIEYQGKREKHRLIFLIKDEGIYKPISFKKKVIISFLGALSFFTGLVNGALNFMSTLSFIFSPQMILGALSMFAAAIPAVSLALAVCWIFFKVIADFIKYDRHKQIAAYVHKTFFDVPWGEMTKTEKAEHVGKCVAKTFICLTAIALTAVVTVATFGVFYNSCLGLLQKIANINAMDTFSKISTWINAITSFPFQVYTSNKVMQAPFFRTRHTFSDVIKPEKPMTSSLNVLQKEAIKLKKVEKTSALLFNIGNGAGQMGIDKTSQTIFSSNSTFNEWLTMICGFFYSALPNASAANDSISQKQVIPCNKPIKSKKGVNSKNDPNNFSGAKSPASVRTTLYDAYWRAWLATEQHIAGKRILVSISDDHKLKLLPYLQQLDEQNWQIYSTGGTHAMLSKNGVGSYFAYKTSEKEEPNISSIISNRKVDLIINIPTRQGNKTLSDGFMIRRMAIDHHIPLITNIQSAQIILQCLIELKNEMLPVRSWQEIVRLS